MLSTLSLGVFGGLARSASASRGGRALVASSSELTPADAAMARYADGDDGAFPEVHRAVAERLRTFLLRLCRSQALADDLAQETLLRMHRARASFAPGAKLLPWAYAIARNVHIDHARSRASRRDEPAPDSGDVASPLAGPEASGEEILRARELAAIVEDTLASMSANQREAFVLIRYEGLSVEEAAAVLGVSEGAVKLRAFHAYEALRAALGDAAPKKATHASKANPKAGRP